MPLGDWLHEGAAKDHVTGFGFIRVPRKTA